MYSFSKKAALLILLFFPFSFTYSQIILTNIDSAKRVLRNAKEDTATATLLDALSNHYFDSNKDSAFFYWEQEYALSQKLNYQKGIAQVYLGFSSAYYQQNNAPKALEYAYKLLHIAEQLNDSSLLADSYQVIAFGFQMQKNYEQSLQYFKKGYSYADHSSDIHQRARFLTNIGATYNNLSLPDSALFYYQKGYQLQRATDKKYLEYPLAGLARSNFIMGNEEVGMVYLRQSINAAKAANNLQSLSESYNILAGQFLKAKKGDSALYYARASAEIANLLRIKGAWNDDYSIISQVFESKHLIDSAFLYEKKVVALKDSMEAENDVTKLQSIAFEEKTREIERNVEAIRLKEEHHRNIEYAAIAIGIISFIILFFLFSRSIIVTEKFISFFGVLGLLAVFEFINLLIHPYLETFTNDSPVWMLMTLIGIGALLVPLHHKLEHWITHKMIEKNKKVRLKAAKKTIEQLEENKANVNTKTSTNT